MCMLDMRVNELMRVIIILGLKTTTSICIWGEVSGMLLHVDILTQSINVCRSGELLQVGQTTKVGITQVSFFPHFNFISTTT